MPPGAGKTRTAILAMRLSGITRGLYVIVPPGIAEDWVAEMKLQGVTGRVIKQTQLHKCWKLVAEQAKGIIFDEAHQINQNYRAGVSKVKRADGKLEVIESSKGLYAGACRSICHNKHTQNTKMLFLTATPAQNSLEEHYWLHSCITGERNKERYMRRFYNSFTMSYAGYQAQKDELEMELPYHIAEYRRETSMMIVRHTTPDQYEEFKKTLNSYRIHQTPEQCGLPTFVGRQKEIDFIEEKGLRQALDEIKKCDNAVIFYFNTQIGKDLQKELTKHGYCDIINGQTKNKLEKIDQFVNEDESARKYLVCQIKAAGVGFSITRTYDVYFVQSGWSPAANYQAASRCRRKSDTKPVNVTFFVQPEDNRYRIVSNKGEFFKEVGGV